MVLMNCRKTNDIFYINSHESLRNLVSESPDFIWINYQIESIQQERLQRHSNPLSIKNAIKFIDS